MHYCGYGRAGTPDSFDILRVFRPKHEVNLRGDDCTGMTAMQRAVYSVSTIPSIWLRSLIPRMLSASSESTALRMGVAPLNWRSVTNSIQVEQGGPHSRGGAAQTGNCTGARFPRVTA